MHGVLVLDKPTAMSSASAVDKVKRRLGASRAGHGGTLDPLATGVLAVCLGEATKLAGYLLADDKAYEADVVFGVQTDTLDRTGAITATATAAFDRDALVAALAKRTGEQEQIPPMYSALKHDGVRLYERARAGEHVEREPRRIRIDRFELVDFQPAVPCMLTGDARPRARLAIACSKGTYIRSLVADIGTDLGCGAHMAELRRTRSGRFGIADAQTLDHLDASRLVPLASATSLPRVRVPAEFVPKIRAGLQLAAELLGATAPQFQLVDEADNLVAIGHTDGGKIVYDRVFVAL